MCHFSARHVFFKDLLSSVGGLRLIVCGFSFEDTGVKFVCIIFVKYRSGLIGCKYVFWYKEKDGFSPPFSLCDFLVSDVLFGYLRDAFSYIPLRYGIRKSSRYALSLSCAARQVSIG